MDFLRTPDSRFERLLDYPFEPHYADVGGLRMHYLDEGQADAKPVLMMHGEPSWSYLYRHMIPICAAAGHRVLAPDLIGFGKSDKPITKSAHTYAGHVAWMRSFIEKLDLTGIHVFVQDWGGLIGLRVLAEVPQRFASLTAGNTGLPAAPFQGAW